NQTHHGTCIWSSPACCASTVMLASIYHLRFRAKPGPEVSSTGTSRPTAPGLHSARSVLTTPSRRNTPLHNLAKILAYPPTCEHMGRTCAMKITIGPFRAATAVANRPRQHTALSLLG